MSDFDNFSRTRSQPPQNPANIASKTKYKQICRMAAKQILFTLRYHSFSLNIHTKKIESENSCMRYQIFLRWFCCCLQFSRCLSFAPISHIYTVDNVDVVDIWVSRQCRRSCFRAIWQINLPLKSHMNQTNYEHITKINILLLLGSFVCREFFFYCILAAVPQHLKHFFVILVRRFISTPLFFGILLSNSLLLA